MKNWPFPVLCSLVVFQICWHIKCGTLTALSFRIWNSSAEIPLSPLALFLVILPKTHWTSNSKTSTWVIAPSCLYGSLRSFSYSSSVYSCYLFSISSAYVRSTLFLSFIVPIFAWNVSFISLIFLKTLLIFPILLFPSISLHWSFSKTFLSFLAVLWNSEFRWICLSLFFISHLLIRLPLTTILISCISSFGGWFWLLPPLQCYEALSIVLQVLQI